MLKTSFTGLLKDKVKRNDAHTVFRRPFGRRREWKSCSKRLSPAFWKTKWSGIMFTLSFVGHLEDEVERNDVHTVFRRSFGRRSESEAGSNCFPSAIRKKKFPFACFPQEMRREYPLISTKNNRKMNIEKGRACCYSFYLFPKRNITDVPYVTINSFKSVAAA